MVEIGKHFLSQTASDLMSGNPVTVNAKDSLRSAAEMLSKNQLSGVPVVDDDGRCVGVLSATDFVQWLGASGDSGPQKADPFYRMSTTDRIPIERVSEWMTADPVTVDVHQNIKAIARMMLDAHIHRVVVVDEEQRPVGLVASTDILSAVAYAENIG